MKGTTQNPLGILDPFGSYGSPPSPLSVSTVVPVSESPYHVTRHPVMSGKPKIAPLPRQIPDYPLLLHPRREPSREEGNTLSFLRNDTSLDTDPRTDTFGSYANTLLHRKSRVPASSRHSTVPGYVTKNKVGKRKVRDQDSKTNS